MAPGSPDDKHVGDATLQRIDDLAGGWSLPRRRREGAEISPTPEPAHPEAKETPGKSAGPAVGSADRTRGLKKTKKPPREKTRAKGKERIRTAASLNRRSPGEMAVPSLLSTGRGTEKPPEPDAEGLGLFSRDATSRAGADRLAGGTSREAGPRPGPDDRDGAGRADSEERAETEVSDRAATRALSARVGTEVSDRAATRVLEDRAETEFSDHAATLIFGDRAETRAETRDAPARIVASEAASGRTGDETVLESPGAGAYVQAAAEARKVGGTTAVLRLPPTLPRRRGVLGDMLYIYTAIVGLARARRELAAADRKLEAEKESRARRLADLARIALADSALVSDTVARGREEIIELEDQRSRVAGAAAAADAAIASLERDRDDEKKRHAQEIEALRRSGAEMADKLQPLQRRLRAVRRRATRLHEAMAELDRRLTRAEARLAGMGADQKATAEAHIASLRAERQELTQEEPALASEIDLLEPAIASLIASRADGRTGAARIEQQERDGVVRAAEKVSAIEARRVVDERAEAELAQAQEDALRALGERLAVERPAELGPRLRGIEEHEVAIATLQRRHLELTELAHGVDRWALARGVLWLLVLAVAVAAALVWSVALRAT